MSTTTPEHQLPATIARLRTYAVAVLAASVATQVILIATGNSIGWLAAGLTGAIAVGYATFLLRHGGALGRVRFGRLAAHAVTYAAVCGGYLLHFFLLAATGDPAVAGGDGLALDPGWFGVAISMPAFWSVGLFTHAVGAIAGRGFEASA